MTKYISELFGMPTKRVGHLKRSFFPPSYKFLEKGPEKIEFSLEESLLFLNIYLCIHKGGFYI